MKYVGCYHCEKNGRGFDCYSHSKPVHIKFLQDEVWDNCGRDTTVFWAGDEVNGDAVIEGNKVFCAVATSPLYNMNGYIMNLANVEISLIEGTNAQAKQK